MKKSETPPNEYVQIIEDSIKNINDNGQFRHAFAEVLREFGCRLPQNIPGNTIFSKKSLYTKDGARIHGMALRDHVRVYSKVVSDVRHRNIRLPLAALYINTHEQVHLLSDTSLDTCTTSLEKADVTFECSSFISGFLICTSFVRVGSKTEIPPSDALFVQFNEGATEIIARMVVRKFLEIYPPKDTSEKDVSFFLESMEDGNRIAYYPEAVSFIRSLVSYIHKNGHLPEQDIWEWLVRSYIRGTDLRTNAVWKKYVTLCPFLPRDFTKQLESATVDDIKQLEDNHLKLFEGLEVVVDEKPHKNASRRVV